MTFIRYNSLLRFFVWKLVIRFQVSCNCALKLYIITWLCNNLSNLVLNVLVVLADTGTTQLGKLFHVFTTLLYKKNFRRSYFYMRLFKSQIVSSSYIYTSFIQSKRNTWLIFSSHCLVCLDLLYYMLNFFSFSGIELNIGLTSNLCIIRYSFTERL